MYRERVEKDYKAKKRTNFKQQYNYQLQEKIKNENSDQQQVYVHASIQQCNDLYLCIY